MNYVIFLAIKTILYATHLRVFTSHLCTLNIRPGLASKLFVMSVIMLIVPPLNQIFGELRGKHPLGVE